MLFVNKRSYFIITLLLIIPARISYSLEISSGDAELDITLEKINLEAEVDLGAFKADLSLTYDVTQDKVEYLFAEIEMGPAEVYMTLELAKIADTPVDTVVELYEEYRRKGWGA